MWKTFFYFSFSTDKTEKTKTKNEKQNAKWKTKRRKNPKERNKIKDFQPDFHFSTAADSKSFQRDKTAPKGAFENFPNSVSKLANTPFHNFYTGVEKGVEKNKSF